MDAEDVVAALKASEVEAVCKHCGMKIRWIADGWGVHLEGSNRGKSRCGSESKLPYGYNAEPEGHDCVYPCLGEGRD